MQTTRERHLLQQQQQRNNNNNNSPHVWQQRQWLLLASVLMLTLFTRTIQGITEELSPGKCGRLWLQKQVHHRLASLGSVRRRRRCSAQESCSNTLCIHCGLKRWPHPTMRPLNLPPPRSRGVQALPVSRPIGQQLLDCESHKEYTFKCVQCAVKWVTERHL